MERLACLRARLIVDWFLLPILLVLISSLILISIRYIPADPSDPKNTAPGKRDG